MRITLDLFPNARKKALTMSYDDGTVHDRRLAELFDQYGIRGTFHLNSGLLGDSRHISAAEIPELYKNHEISCHTVTHPFLTLTPREFSVEEIASDRHALEIACGYPVRGMSYPFGAYNEEVIKVMRSAGIEYARTTVATNGFGLPADFMAWHPTCHHNGDISEKFDSFIEPHRYGHPMLFYIWGHSYEFDSNGNWSLMEDFCVKAGRREDIWYATNIEIVDYLNALRALRFSADSKLIYNPSAADVWLTAGNRPVMISAGKTVSL